MKNASEALDFNPLSGEKSFLKNLINLITNNNSLTQSNTYIPLPTTKSKYVVVVVVMGLVVVVVVLWG